MILTKCALPRSPRGLAWHQRSSGSMPPEDVADRSKSQTHAKNNNTVLHTLTGKCRHFLSNTYRGWTGHHKSNQWELMKICICWFELSSVRRQICGNDHLSCGWTSTIPLGLKWKSAQGKGRISLGSSHIYISCECQPTGSKKFDPCRFYCVKLGYNNLFPIVYLTIVVKLIKQSKDKTYSIRMIRCLIKTLIIFYLAYNH